MVIYISVSCNQEKTVHTLKSQNALGKSLLHAKVSCPNSTVLYLISGEKYWS